MSHFLMSQELEGKLGPYLPPENEYWDKLVASNGDNTVLATFPVVQSGQAWEHDLPALAHLHGFEEVKLDFDAKQYFAFFDWQDDVISGDNLYRDPPLPLGRRLPRAHKGAGNTF
jgi:hypothetical protein